MSCCHKANCKKQAACQPSEEFLGDVLNGEHLRGLLEIARAGLQAGNIFRRFVFKSAALEQLAKQVADLAMENAYLKKITDLFLVTPVRVEPTDNRNMVLNFGAAANYQLIIPVNTDNDRKLLIKQLRAAADVLAAQETPDDKQSLLPFNV
jgi:hypothetical protein